jgi:2-methylcitrate dehydratase
MPTTVLTLAERLADYAARLRFEDLPAEVVHEAKRVTVDALGCAIGAWKEEPCIAIRSVASDFSATKNGSTIWGTKHVAPPDWTALHNCLCVRYFDYNDTYLSKEPAHPSDNIPACFSAGESISAHGRDVITAIVLAYEVQCRFADAVSIRARGWDHVTYGAFSTALAASKLFKLDKTKTKHALGIAGVNSAALRQSRVGELSHWKGTAFANAARHGVYSALLARAGVTGPAPIFEGEKGFEKLVSGEAMRVAPPFGPEAMSGIVPPDGFMIRKSCIKFYPAEYHAQSAVGAALDLRKDLKIDDIDTVLVESHDAAVDIIGSEPEKWKPNSRETADHSLPYMVAAALMDGELTDRQFEPDRFTEKKLLDLVQRVQVRRHKELSAMYPEAVGNIVSIHLKGGKVLTKRIDYPKGHAKNRLTDQELELKYHALADPVMGIEKANAILKWVWQLDKQADLRGLMPLLEMSR